jgi:transposase
MSKQIKADHTQIFLLPPALEDWVPSDHPSRFIHEFVKGLDLNDLGFSQDYTSGPGRSGYSSELMLCIWLYGCYQRIYSSRKLEFACKNEMAMIWLTGMNYPDHNSIWRFWKNHRLAIKKIFKQTVLVADRLGMVGMVLNAVDGTKIMTVSSRRSLWNKSSLEKKSALLDERILALEKEIDSQEGEQDNKMELPQKLQNAKILKESIEAAKSFLESKQLQNYHPLEEDARVMKNQRVYEPCYNGQAVVDSKNQIITAEALVNEENDRHQLIPMLDLLNENLGKVAEENLADSGYQMEKSIQEAADRGYEILINDQNQKAILNNPFHSTHFYFDESKGSVVCPKGTELKFESSKKGKPNQGNIKVFRCKNKECPFRDQCSKETKGKSIEVTAYRTAVQDQNQKRNTTEGKMIMKSRMVIIEPVFAAIKSIRSFNRFTYRTLKKAGVQWSFMCAIHNLKKIFNLRTKGGLLPES